MLPTSSIVGFSQGLNQQRDRGRRQRRELAEAFAQFKQQNPYATMAEFQDFIDRSAGGSNYLRGGLPSDQVLQSIATQNQEAKRQADFKRRLEEVADLQRTRGLLEGQAEALAMSMGAGNVEKARQEFYSMFGDEYSDILGKTGIDNIFTPAYVQQKQDALVRSRLPQAMDLIKNGFIDMESPTAADDLAAMANIPATFAKSLFDAAKTRYDKQQEEEEIRRTEAAFVLKRDLESDLLGSQQIASAVQRLSPSEAQTLILERTKSYLPDSQFEDVFGIPKDQASPTLMDSLYNVVLTNLKQQQSDDLQTRYDSATTQASQSAAQLRANNPQRVQETLDDRSANFKEMGEVFAALGAEFAQRYYMSERALGAFQGAFENAMRENPNSSYLDLKQAVMQDPGFVAALKDEPTLNEYSQRFVDEKVRLTAGPGRAMTYRSWESEQKAAINDGFNDFDSKLDKINDQPLEVRLAMLQSAKQNLAALRQDALTSLQSDRQLRNTWLEVGDRWDDQSFSTLPQAIDARVAEVERKIEQMAERTRAAQQASQPEQLPPMEAPPPSEDKSVIRLWFEGAVGELDDLGTRGKLMQSNWPLLTVPEAEYVRRREMREWAKGGVMDRIVELYRQGDQRQREMLVSDFQTLDKAAFEKKYGDQLKAQANR